MMQNTSEIIELLKDFVDPALLQDLEGSAPGMPEADRLKRVSMLERIGSIEWAPVKTYLDGMLDSFKSQLESPQSDAATNYVRGNIAMIRFFLNLPSMAEQELSRLTPPKEGTTDSSEGTGSV